MIAEVKDFLTPFGGTMGELISATPRDKISRVFLEDKLFETWHAGRTVLIGDACHKVLEKKGTSSRRVDSHFSIEWDPHVFYP